MMQEISLNLAADEKSNDAGLCAALRRHLEKRGQTNVEKNVGELLNCDMYDGRFFFFMPLVSESAKDRMLISGCAVGSELIVARRRGFRDVTGTEVDPELVELARSRLRTHDGCRVDLLDGTSLPYPDGSFSTVYSAHVIEHTPSPEEYFREHFRVLKPGGFFFLEFPNRYHHTELHTGLPSLEWLPEPLRNGLLHILASRLSPLTPLAKRHYDLVRRTLSPVGVPQIRRFLKTYGAADSTVVALRVPVPGFVQILLRK